MTKENIKKKIESLKQYLPAQLRQSQFRFCKIRKNTKIPYQRNWPEKPIDYEEIERHIKKEINYGVICGLGDLIVIDCDKNELAETIEKELPATFKVKTGGGGFHYYFICPELEKKIVLQNDKEHFGEVQSKGTQVVGAGSILKIYRGVRAILRKGIADCCAIK